MPDNYKKQWNIKVTAISIVIDVLRRVPKGLLKGLEYQKGQRRNGDHPHNRSVRILRRVLET